MKTPSQPAASSHLRDSHLGDSHRRDSHLGDSPRWLRASIVAGATTLALMAGGFAACGGDLGEGSQHSNAVDNAAAGGADGGGDANFGIPTKDLCAGNADKTICTGNTAITCGAEGNISSSKDCVSKVCVDDEGCVLCLAGEFSCQGSTVASCDTSGAAPTWDLGDTCDQAANKVCDAAKGACVDIKPTGSAVATGTYYQFAQFNMNASEFLGGFDVDTFENTIYVNRAGHLDAYTIELVDSDGDGKPEPNQHPDNPDETGPIEERKLKLLKTYTVPELGGNGSAELYAADGKVYFLHGSKDVYQIDLASGKVSALHAAADATVRISHLGYDDVHDIWYGSSERYRRVFAFHPTTKSWALQFEYPDMAGSHMDGMEVVTDPETGTAYVYVSDMTSDYLGQYRYDRKLGWVQVNVFEYNGTAGQPVEGMGFGALNHFWATGYSMGTSGTWSYTPSLYEIGGGDLGKFVEPVEEGPK